MFEFRTGALKISRQGPLISWLWPFYDVDASRIHDLGEAVGDDDHRAALLEGVEAGGGHVGEYDGWVFDEEPGAGDALLLAA